jgi:hypothetical protein
MTSRSCVLSLFVALLSLRLRRARHHLHAECTSAPGSADVLAVLSCAFRTRCGSVVGSPSLIPFGKGCR